MVIARAPLPPTAPRPGATAAPPPPGPSAAPAAPVDTFARGSNPVGARLDAHLAKFSPEYKIPGEAGPKRVATPFRMIGGTGQPSEGVARGRCETALTKAGKWTPAMAAAVKRANNGRGSAEDIQRVTQGLIDAGKLPPAIEVEPGGAVRTRSVEERVRTMQFDHGIGVDCKGYVLQASAAAKGKSLAAMGTENVFTPSGYFGSFDPGKGYQRVKPASAKDGSIDARPGDVISLDHPTSSIGHYVVCRDKRPLAPGELSKASGSSFLLGADGKTPAKVIRYDVDSSWGADGKPMQGGVQRETWLYNPETQRWAELEPGQPPRIARTDGPYGHKLSDVFRPR